MDPMCGAAPAPTEGQWLRCWRTDFPRCWRGRFQYGDLQAGFEHTRGGGASANLGSHSCPHRSHRYAVTVFLKIAIRRSLYHAG